MKVLIKREVGEVREIRRLKGRRGEARKRNRGRPGVARKRVEKTEGRQAARCKVQKQPLALQETWGGAGEETDWGLLTLQGPTVGLRHLRDREAERRGDK